MKCAICLSGFERNSECTLLCGHVFHVACTRKVLDSGGKTCPLCRAAFPQNPKSADAGRLRRLLIKLNNG